MNALGGGKANELTFQNDKLKYLVANGWLQDKAENYNRKLALHPEYLLGFVQDIQPEQCQKICALSPSHPKQHFHECFANPLNNTDSKAGRAMAAFCSAPALSLCEPAKAMEE